MRDPFKSMDYPPASDRGRAYGRDLTGCAGCGCGLGTPSPQSAERTRSARWRAGTRRNKRIASSVRVRYGFRLHVP